MHPMQSNLKLLTRYIVGLNLLILILGNHPCLGMGKFLRALTPSSGLITAPIDQNIQLISQAITEVCSPQDCLVIGIGRSPTPITVNLKEVVSPNYAWNLPLSSFHHSIHGDSDLPPPVLEKLFQHFKKFLPDLNVLQKRKLLLVDFVFSGASLISAKEHIREYYELLQTTETLPTPVIEAFGISKFDPRDPSDPMNSEINYWFLLRNNSPLFNAFSNQAFDDYAQYGTYYVENESPSQATTNPKYQWIEDEINVWRRKHPTPAPGPVVRSRKTGVHTVFAAKDKDFLPIDLKLQEI